MNAPDHIREAVMERIRKGGVAMKPRWQFVLTGVLWGAGALLALLVLLYFASLVVFVLRQNGVWLAPILGARGWFDIIRSAPVLIILLVAFCAIVLNVLVRRFAFGYRRPVTISLGAVLLATLCGGVLVGVSPFHREVHRQYRHGNLPPAFGSMYEHPFRPRMPDDVYRGVVIERMGSMVFMRDATGATTTVHVSPHTRLPFGADFAPGDTIVVLGDVASGTIEAFGIIEGDPDLDDRL